MTIIDAIRADRQRQLEQNPPPRIEPVVRSVHTALTRRTGPGSRVHLSFHVEQWLWLSAKAQADARGEPYGVMFERLMTEEVR